MEFGWPYSTKPGRGTTIDVTHPLARGLASYALFSEDGGAPCDLVARQSWTAGGSPAWTPGPRSVSPGMSFNGSSQYLQLGTSSTLGVTTGTSFTVEAWFTYSGAESSDSSVVGKCDSGTTTGWGLRVDDSSPPSYPYLTFDGGYAATPSGLISVGPLYHLVGVASWNGSVYNGYLYLNGVQVSDGPDSATSSTLTNYGQPPTIARNAASGAGGYFHGTIYQTSFRSLALSASQVLSLYQQPWQVFAPGPLRSWVFFQGAPTYAVAGKGGVVCGGSAAPSAGYAPVPAGGPVVGGTTSESSAYTPTPSGGAVLGGTAPASASFAPDPSGGPVLGGTAPGSLGGASAGLGFWPQAGKPGRGRSIDPTNPLARGLVFFAPLWDGAGPSTYDLVSGTTLALAGSAAWGAASQSALQVIGAGAAQVIAPASLQLAGPMTIAVGWHYASQQSNQGGLFGLSYTNSNTSPYYAAGFRLAGSFTAYNLYHDIGGSLRTVGATAAIATGNDYVFSASLASGLQSIYTNGVAGGSSAYSGSITYGTNSYLYIGNCNTVFGAYGTGGLVYWAAIWARTLSAAEHAAIGAGPNAIWAIIRRTPVFAVGGAPSFAGSASGGAVAGGLAPPSSAFMPAPAGGAVLGGSTSYGSTFAASASGGAVLGGLASYSGSSSFTASASGGPVLGGLAAHSSSYTPAPSGGVVLGGLISPGGSFTAFAAGGLTLGGTAAGSIPGTTFIVLVDPDAGSLIDVADDPGEAEVDPDSGSLIIL
jgi:hypothetical protein